MGGAGGGDRMRQRKSRERYIVAQGTVERAVSRRTVRHTRGVSDMRVGEIVAP